MEAIELRIENLFYPIQRRNPIHLPLEIPYKVVEIGLFKVRAIRATMNIHHATEYQEFSLFDLSPIPIDHAYLQLLGFEPSEGLNYKGEDVMMWYYMDFGGFFLEDEILKPKEFYFADAFSENIKIKYVHQLQNVTYSLSGYKLPLFK